MDVLERIGLAGIVPQAVIERAEDAVPTAEALRSGGADVMALSFREGVTEALAAIRQSCPEMLVGVCGVTTPEQCALAEEAGAAFVMMPGYRDDAAAWCVEHGLCLIPGCVTPSEIMAAMARVLRVVGFGPAAVYGGLEALRALSAAFPEVRFLPTGEMDQETLADHLAAPFVLAVASGRLCPEKAVAAHDTDAIAAACRAGRQAALGFELAHVGINTEDGEQSLAVCQALEEAFGFRTKKGNSSNFAGPAIEVMKSLYLGRNGHIAVRTNSIPRAIAELGKHGFQMDEGTAKSKNGKMTAIYLKDEIGGFAIHLLQK